MTASKFGRAWVFPGVGVKPNGYESALYLSNHSIFLDFFDQAAELSGRDLRACLSQAPEAFPEGLDEQILGYGFACGLVELLRRQGRAADILGGNSFGVYPAVWAAGCLDFAQGLHILTAAFRCMEAASHQQDCSLCAIVGLSKAEAEAIIAETQASSVLCINANNQTCYIFSGLSADINRFAEACQAAGAINAAVLPVALPYHHPHLTQSVKAEFAQAVQELEWRSPSLPIISTIDSSVLETPTPIADFVARQIFQPIDWSASVRSLYALGVTSLFECGLGMSLTQNARFIDGQASWENCKTLMRRSVNA